MEDPSLRRLNEVSALLVRTPGKSGDLTTVLQHIAEKARDAFATDVCIILAFNPITTSFLGSHTVVGDLQFKNELFDAKPRQAGATQQTLKDGILLVEDLDAQPHYRNRFTRREDIRAFASIALQTRHRKRPLGVIYLDYREPRKFSSKDYEFYRNFATQASLILQETWVAHNYEQVARIGQDVNQNLATVDDLFAVLQKYVEALLDDSHTLLLATRQPQMNTLDIRLRTQTCTKYMNMPLQGACKHVIETREALFIKQLSAEAEQFSFQVINITETEQKESHIFVPLLLRNNCLGVLSIQHPLPNAYGQEDLFVLQLLANYIALALHNTRLFNNLNQLNEIGQLLTQQLESEQVLQVTVEKIQVATKSDIVILYPYDPAFQRFTLPPRVAGTLQDSIFPQSTQILPDEMAALTLHHVEPIFAKESTNLYKELYGDMHIHQGNFQEREKICSTAAVPLQVGDEIVGVLFVNFRQPQRFDATQKVLIEGLAHYAAIAIKNAQVFGTLSQRRVQELEILQKIDRELNSTLDLKSVLNTLLTLANEQVHADVASILLHNQRMQTLEIPAALGHHAQNRQSLVIPLQETKYISRWVLENKKPARVGNVHQDPRWSNLYIEATAGIVSELDVPLMDEEEVIGVLNFESTRENAFRQEDEHFLITLAGQAVLAIKNAQAFEREKRLAEERRVLNEISKEITSQLNLTHVFDLILEKALELTGSTLGSLHRYDRELNHLEMVASQGVAEDKKGVHQSLDQGIVGHVAKHKQLCIVEDVSQSPWNEFYLEFFPGSRSELAVPLLAGDELRGVLNVESPHLKNFGERDERLLQGLAGLAVIALQNAQAYEREKRLVSEAQGLHEISKKITSQFDHVDVFELILEKTLELTDSSLGVLLLYDADLGNLGIAAQRGLDEGKEQLRIALHEGIVGYVATHKRMLNIVDVTQPPWNDTYLAIFPETRSELTVPMLAGDELRGVLNVESIAPNHFGASDELLLKGLADLAVVALQNAERYDKAKRDAQRFQLLYLAGQELSKITDLSQLERAYDIVLQIAKEQSQSLVVIRRYDEENQELDLIYASQPQNAGLRRRTKLDVGIHGQVARERRTLVIHDIKNPPPGVTIAEGADFTRLSRLIAPIMFKEEYYGNLVLSHRDVAHFRGADILFYELLAQQLASTIHRLETVQASKEAEQRAKSAEAMSSIGQMAFELTHRWDNDLGLVQSYVNDIQSELRTLDLSNGFIAKKLDNIVQATRTVLVLGKDLKQEFARSGEAVAGEPILLQSRVSTNEPTILHPKVLLEEVLNPPSLPATIQMIMEVDEDVALVQVIHNLVIDILRNLVSNAIDAVHDNKCGKISLRTHNAGNFVAVEVADRGVGIPQKNLSKIFDLFYSTKGSSGFGLWSARRNAFRNHGDLTVQSEPGQGTTFTLLLPRVEGGQHEA